MDNLTPMMQQYESIKRKHKNAILFFRLGDFYEMFNEDARIASRVLDLALTSRNKGGGKKTDMAGVPAHSAEPYIAKLIDNDYKVAICEQMEDPDEADGIVKRDVIRIVTPGTVIEDEMLKDDENNFLAAIVEEDNYIGLSFLDISTGEFHVTEINVKNKDKLWDELDRIRPREILINTLKNKDKYENLQKNLAFLENDLRGLTYKRSYKLLLEQFKTQSLSGFGCDELSTGIIAAGEIINFLKDTQKKVLAHIDKINYYTMEEFMIIDSITRRNLELLSTIRNNKLKGSLLSFIDNTLTSMGGRLLKKWLNQPLINKEGIDQRLDAIDELINNYIALQDLRNDLDGIYDLERILSKIIYGSANARDLYFLKNSLKKLPNILNDIKKFDSNLFCSLYERFDDLSDLTEILENAIVDDPPFSVREGGLIKNAYNEKLDELRQLRKKSKDWIVNLQKKERERTSIGSLKVGFNKIFGYYLEVTNPNLDKVPEEYKRKQTLSNSERYIIPELKEKEALVLGAEEKINEIEYKLFVEIREFIGKNIKRVKNAAEIISIIDLISSLSLVAIENDYIRPEVNTDEEIYIKEGRHPVVEQLMEDNYVPNDTLLDLKNNRFIIITGPNMSGKSTYMRQVALIVLLAQMGSFVPAKEAEIGIVDRIFTRVGASDDLTTGQSTFMVEMNEVANIVNNATNKSLIILDEVGRGTSTYDGVSIAWAVSEYINNPQKIGARSLFATHYHELTKLKEEHNGIKNYNVLVEEDDKGVHFLHKIVEGCADESYGIEVARLAGIPEEIINKSKSILNKLEDKELADKIRQSESSSKVKQMPLFKMHNEIEEKILGLDILHLTPMKAMNFLYNLQTQLRKEDKEHG